MYIDQFLFEILLTIAIELVVEAFVRKSTPFLLEPYVAFAKQTKYLIKIITRPRFSQWFNKFFRWERKVDKYIELEVLESQAITYSGVPQSAQLMLSRYLSLDGSRPFVLVGEPGSGKTTTLEALATRTASRALERQIVYFAILFFMILATVGNFFSLLLVLIFWGLIFRYMLQGIILLRTIKKFIEEKILRLPPKTVISLIPIFIDARSGYSGGDVREWCLKVSKDLLGKNILHFNQYDGIAWFIDGINEISGTLYPTFIEGWREIIRESPSMPIAFSSRIDQNPAHRIGLECYLTVCSLNDFAVKNFIETHHRLKTDSKKSLLKGINHVADFEELVRNGLLGDDGIGRNPYWLSMILSSDFYTPNKGRLFTKFIEELLTREVEKKPEERKRKSIWKNIVPVELEVYALSNLANAMHSDGLIGYSTEEGWRKARNIIKHCIDGMPYTVDDVLEEADASSLLKTKFRDRVEFVHQLVQEYFVAVYLNNLIKNVSHSSSRTSISDIMGESLLHKDMSEIIIMLIGISDYQSEIADWLANQIVEKRHKSSISLLKRCIEIVYETTDADISKEVVNSLLGSTRDPDIHIRWDTVVLLGEIKNANALEPLIIDLLEPNALSKQRISKLIEKSDPPSINKLISFLQNPNPIIRRNTIEFLEKINDEWVIEPIVETLKDNDPNVRWQAVYTLGKIGNERVLEELEGIATKDDTVAHSNLRIADTALEAIWKIQNRVGIQTENVGTA